MCGHSNGGMKAQPAKTTMNALDEHGRQIPDEPTGTIQHWRIPPFLCAHAWHEFSVQRDGFEHRMCATCGADLGLVGYCATYSTYSTNITAVQP